MEASRACDWTVTHVQENFVFWKTKHHIETTLLKGFFLLDISDEIPVAVERFVVYQRKKLVVSKIVFRKAPIKLVAIDNIE